MMATAPTINQASDASAIVSTSTQLDLDAQDGSRVLTGHPTNNQSVVDNKRISNIEDQPDSAEVSVSGGSDNEASRADGASHRDGNHGRTTSTAKKPATFKAVSVNKSFLGAKALVSSPSLKATDRPSGSSTPPTGSATLSVSRPRLVAKTGSGQKDGLSRLSSINGSKPATAPSPNAVWNKNRPPEPKKLTDEELKKYGIHMASRLNEDETQGQSKWADIDDDDDDWAPEAITWGDGTKTTLPHPDETPVPAAVPEPVPTEIQPRITLAKKAPTPASNAKPRQGNGGLGMSGKGLVLKANSHNVSSEKPALVAKPSQLQQGSKSPWATLPPVDRISPAAPPSSEPSLPVRATPNTMIRNMNESFREGGYGETGRAIHRDHHAPRELFNPQSGRYEPLPDRRGSNHANLRPAVLQRPHSPTADRPAEPSSAFQTSRLSHEPSFGRRRGSSSVSNGSMPFFRKGPDGAPPGSDGLGARRPSLAGSAESPLSPIHKFTQPSVQQTVASQSERLSHISPQSVQASLQDEGVKSINNMLAQPSEQAQMDEVEFQKKLMRERQEMARKRRQEEEAQEEAARRERIQKKLAAMGPAPEKKSDKKQGAVANEGVKPTHIQQRSQPASVPKGSDVAQKEGAQRRISTSKGQPETPAKATRADQQQASAAEPQNVSAEKAAGSRSPNIWAGSAPQSDRLPQWVARPEPAPTSRNVWGSPDADNKALGNGTFNPDLGRISGSSAPVPSGVPGPAPIGPPNMTRVALQPRAPPQQAPIGSKPATRYPVSGTDLASQWVSAVAENDRQLAAANAQKRMERSKDLEHRGVTVEGDQPVIKDTWRPVQQSSDGSRLPMAVAADSRSQQPQWKTDRAELTRDTQPEGHAASRLNAGVIGSGSSTMLRQSSHGTSSQGRGSRFFPAKENRAGLQPSDLERPTSPAPPPPTMEGHPAYEGNTMRPHVSLPKPQPIVKLPPMMRSAASARPEAPLSTHNFAWSQPQPFKQPPHGASWQARINTLLGAHASSKLPGIDPASKSSFEHHPPVNMATVSIPGMLPAIQTAEEVVTKPLAEECFEEQEMGSLPQIRLPRHSRAAIPRAVPSTYKPFPRKFLVRSECIEAYVFTKDMSGTGCSARVLLPGMEISKTVTVPATSHKGGEKPGHSRGVPRQRGSGRGKKEKPDTTAANSPRGSGHARERDSYRGRGGSWNRQSATATPRTIAS